MSLDTTLDLSQKAEKQWVLVFKNNKGKSYSGKEANLALCKPLSNPGIYGKKL